MVLIINKQEIQGKFVFGEVSAFIRNNWWFGLSKEENPDLHYSERAIIIQASSNQYYCIYPTESNVFKVEQRDYSQYEEKFTFFGHKFSNNAKIGMVTGTLATVGVISGVVATAAVLANQNANNNQPELFNGTNSNGTDFGDYFNATLPVNGTSTLVPFEQKTYPTYYRPLIMEIFVSSQLTLIFQ